VQPAAIVPRSMERRSSDVEAWRFKVLYDGECPFCKVEARWLGHLGRSGRLAVEDIAAPDFDPTSYGDTLYEMMGTLHGVFPDGRQTRGMETFRQAYRAVGLGWLLAPTGWPVLRNLADFLYAGFARHRVRMGRLFGRACEGDRCSLPEARPVPDRAD
jgi:predicted DCC family thiol-disulfide oxidoreductase YuxK